jgi:hypothetical protein
MQLKGVSGRVEKHSAFHHLPLRFTDIWYATAPCGALRFANDALLDAPYRVI